MSSPIQWAPSEDVLAHIMRLFADVRGGVADQGAVFEQLENLRQLPDFAMYVVHIISEPGFDNFSRLQACGQLQDYVAHFPVTASVLEHMKMRLATALNDVASVGPVFARIAIAERLQGWGPVFEHIYNLLAKENPYNVLKNLWYLIEDLASERGSDDMLERLESSELGFPMRHIVPRLIDLVNNGNPRDSILALRVLLVLLDLELPSLDENMEAFVHSTFTIANKVNTPEAQHFVTEAFSRFVSVRIEDVLPFIEQVCRFMINNMSGPVEVDDRARIGACDFWFQLIGGSGYLDGELESEEVGMRKGLMAPFLKDVVPLLISNVKYTEDELLEMESKLRNDALEADDVQDIKPRQYDGMGGDDDEEDDDDDDNEDPEAAWTARRTSGRGIDALSNMFPLEIMTIATPLLSEGFRSDNWLIVEASLLVFGAIAMGCHEHVAPTLPDIGPFVISLMSHEQVPVRSTSCWALSRYAAYIAANNDLAGSFLTAAVERIQDGNKMVQHAACSMLATFIDAADEKIAPFAADLLVVMGKCLPHYQTRSKSLLLDALDSLGKAAGSRLQESELAGQFLTLLIAAWSGMASDDYCIVDLAVFTVTVLNRTGVHTTEAAPQLAASLVAATSAAYGRIMSARQANEIEGGVYAYDVDDDDDVNRISALLDAISALTGALGASSAALWAGSGLLDMLRAALGDPQLSIRISALGLLGDVVVNGAAQETQTFVAEQMQQVVQSISLDPAAELLSNNAAWVLGEVAKRFGAPAFAPEVVEKDIVPRLAGLLVRAADGIDSTVQLTAASTMGRMALLFPEPVAKLLPHMRSEWSYWLAQLRIAVEEPYRGYCAAIGIAPQVMAEKEGFVALVRALYAAMEEPKLHGLVGEVMTAFKSLMGPRWGQVWAELPPALAQTLLVPFGL